MQLALYSGPDRDSDVHESQWQEGEVAHTISSTSSSSRGLLRAPPAPPSGLNTSASLARPCKVLALTQPRRMEQGKHLSLSHGDMQAGYPAVCSDGTIIICLPMNRSDAGGAVMQAHGLKSIQEYSTRTQTTVPGLPLGW